MQSATIVTSLVRYATNGCVSHGHATTGCVSFCREAIPCHAGGVPRDPPGSGEPGSPQLPRATLLRAGRLLLDPLRVEHADEMAPLLDDVRLHGFTGGRPASGPELRARYGRQVVGRSPDGLRQWLNWIVRRNTDHVAVGFVQATVTGGEPQTAELAWTIAVPYQRRGYAQEAAAEMLAWLRARGVRRFIARIHPEHGASMAVARSLGLVAGDADTTDEIRWSTEADREPP